MSHQAVRRSGVPARHDPIEMGMDVTRLALADQPIRREPGETRQGLGAEPGIRHERRATVVVRPDSAGAAGTSASVLVGRGCGRSSGSGRPRRRPSPASRTRRAASDPGCGSRWSPTHRSVRSRRSARRAAPPRSPPACAPRAARKSYMADCCASFRSPTRTPLRSKRTMPAGRFDQLAMSGLSGGSTAARACAGSSVSRNRVAAAAVISS